MKYLGITFDNKLTWKPHIQHTCTKLAGGSWTLLNIRNYVDILNFGSDLAHQTHAKFLYLVHQRWAKPGVGVGMESEYGVFCRIRSGVGERFLLICRSREWSRSLVSNYKIKPKMMLG